MEDVTTITVTRRIDISNQEIDDILITAFEGGSNYWIEEIELPKSFPIRGARPLNNMGEHRITYEMISQGYSFFVKPLEDEAKYLLTKDKVLRGIRLFLRKHPKSSLEDYDANDADMILQYGLFGELVFG